MTRIATSYAYQSSVSTLQSRFSDMMQAQERLTSGKRVNSASDDPTAAARAERARALMQRNEGTQRSLEASRNAMTLAEGALGDATDLLQRARELMVSAGNASLGDPERASIADELAGIRDELLGIANQADGAGHFLFGGQGTGQQPFLDAPGGVTFAGIAGSLSSSGGPDMPMTADGQVIWLSARSGNGVFETRNVNSADAWIDAGTVSDPSQVTGSAYSIEFSEAGGVTTYSILRDGQPTAVANAPFSSGQAIEIDGMSFTISGAPAQGDTFEVAASQPDLSVFDAMDKAINELHTPNRTASQATQTVQSGLRDLDAVMANLSGARGRMGETLNRLEGLEGRLSASTLNAETDRSNAEDLDLVKGLTEFQNQQTSYNAALQSYSMVQRMSLFDYLKT